MSKFVQRKKIGAICSIAGLIAGVEVAMILLTIISFFIFEPPFPPS
ncbi:MAG: hypothetical protein ACTSRG_25330 [Candidatus Helarchaeota archaeon]